MYLQELNSSLKVDKLIKEWTLEIQVLVIGRSMLLLPIHMFVGEYGRIAKAEKVKDRGPHDDRCQCCDKNAMCYLCFH